MTLKQAIERYEAAKAAVKQVFDEAGEDRDFAKVKCLAATDSKGRVEELDQRIKAMDDAQSEMQTLHALDAAEKRARAMSTTIGKEPDGAVKNDDKPQFKSLGETFIESKAGGEFKGRLVDVPGVNVKTLMEASAGWDPENVRSGRVVLTAEQPLSVLDYIPMGTYGGDLYKYMKETTKTAGATAVSEGGAYGEAALAYTEASDEVEKVGAWLPITDEQLEDNAGLRSLIDQRLTYFLKAKLETDILTANGTTPNLWGANNLAAVQSQAKGNDPTPSAIHKGITKVQVTGFAQPSVIFMHPNDWQDIRLLTTADGIYIFGSPNDVGVTRLWGIPVAPTTFQTENTALIGDFRAHSMLFMRRGIQFKVSDSHDTYFVNGKQAIRCDLRCVMVYYRDIAFCKVTGI